MKKLERMKTLLEETKALKGRIPSMTEPEAIKAYTEIVGKAEVLLLEMTEKGKAPDPMELHLFMITDREQLDTLTEVHNLILTTHPASLVHIGLPMELDDIHMPVDRGGA